MRIRLFHILVLAIFVLSLASALFYTFSSYMAKSYVAKVRTADSTRSEELFISCSAVNTSYLAGEKAVFYLDVLNLGNRTIQRISFDLRVTALSLFGIQVLETDDYSTRTFVKGITERIVIERDLPAVTPSGVFALQLSAKPEGLDPLHPCELMIYVSSSNYLMILLVLSLVISGTCYGLLRISAYVRRVGTESIGPTFRKAALLLVSTDLFVEHAENRTIDVISSFSIGQKFVFSSILILILTGISLALRIHVLAEQLATVVFFCLAIGVTNLLWENFRAARTLKFKLVFPSRSIVSLLLLTLLLYFSISAVSMVLLVALVVVTVVVAVSSVLKVRKSEH